ncbi:protein kinase domain-containing protein [Nocardiopsis coralliicola]
MNPDPALFVGPPDRPDKYRLVRKVGRGGEGTLYLAEVLLAGSREPVIVKALHAEIAAEEDQFGELSARWAEQAELLRFIDHRGVVGVREHFEGPREHPAGAADPADRSLFLVMNYVDGVPLRAWRKENAVAGPQDAAALLGVLSQAADAIDHLHSGRATPSGRAVVHGDLAPGNVMLGGDGRATLVDFGLSRIAARHVTRSPWFTPGYAAPEVFVGEYSAATDRYAFGGILYFALSGAHPPPSPELAREALGGLPPLAAADPGLRAAILAVFSARPEDRPAAGPLVRMVLDTVERGGAADVPAAAGPPPAGGAHGAGSEPTEALGGGAAAAAAQQGPAQGDPRPGPAPGAEPLAHSEPATAPTRPSRRRKIAVGAAAAALVLAVAGGVGAAAWNLRGGTGEGSDPQAQQAAGPGERGPGATGSVPPSPSPSSSDKGGKDADDGGEDDDSGKDKVNERAGSPLSDRSAILPAKSYSAGAATLDGTQYRESLTVSGACGKPSTEYNLARSSSAFAATVGVDDASSGGANAVFRVVGDGRELASATAGPGEPAEVSADVSGVMRLRLTVDWSGDCSGAVGVWGDPKLT